MKKYISIFLTFIMILTLSACKKTETPAEPSTGDQNINTENQASYDTEDGTHIVVNKDDVTSFAIFSDSHIGQRAVFKRTLERAIEWANANDDLDFVFFLGDNVDNGYYEKAEVSAEQVKTFFSVTSALEKPFYAVHGNHDFRVREFESNCVIQCGDVALVSFFADYYTKDPSDIYDSNGRVSQTQLELLEKNLAKCSGKRVILACHYSIVVGDENFNNPIDVAQPVPARDLDMVDFGREKILELAEKYNVELYFNGHEHNPNMPTGVAGTMTDFNIGSLGNQGVFVLVTVDSNKAIVELRNAEKSGEVIKTVEYTFTRGFAE